VTQLGKVADSSTFAATTFALVPGPSGSIEQAQNTNNNARGSHTSCFKSDEEQEEEEEDGEEIEYNPKQH
jgi:hypothetical protein